MKTFIAWAVIVFVTLSFIDIPPFEDTVIKNFEAHVNKYPKEKVYLHTDKEIYRAGENIWIRGYLVDAITNVPVSPSRYIYVELTDRQDSLVRRIKLMEMDSVFTGNIKLSDNILQGDYCLRAYTYWMQNDGTDYLFKKNILVLNPQEAKINTEVTYSLQDDQTIATTIKCTDIQNCIMANQTFHYQINDGDKPGRTRVTRTDTDGTITLKVKPGDKSIHLFFKNDIPFEFERYFYIPELSDDFDMQFFPEGGSLLMGTLQKVAFKAIGKDGMSRAVSGKVYVDSIPIAKINTEHKGMGHFTIPVNERKHYSVRVKNDHGVEKRFDLPPATDNGIGIRLAATDTAIRVHLQKAVNARFPKELYLMLHCRGQLLRIYPITTLQPQMIDRRLIPEGISHLVIIDADYKVHSQRIFFTYPQRQHDFVITTNNAAYENREKVELSLAALAEDMNGSFSVSVIDSTTRGVSPYPNTILSNLLLTSDLKGYIEEPGYYFSDTTAKVTEHMDLVMLTHGWTRFKVEDMAADLPETINYYLERGQAISGKVENYWSKEARGAQLMMIGENGYAGMIFTDEHGVFVNDEVAFPDSTRFIIQALNNKGKQRVMIHVDEEKYLPISNYFPYNPVIKENDDDFFQKYYQNYYYENGVKIYMLNEVKVFSKAPKKKYSFYDNWVDDSQRLDSAQIAAIDEEDILKIIGHIPGIMVIDQRVLAAGEYKPDKGDIPIYVNGFSESSITFVKWLQKKDLLGISLLKGSLAENVFQAGQVLLITTVPGHQLMKPHLTLNVKQICPLGVFIPDEFYVPRYDVDSVRNNGLVDDRTTLYWNPDVRLRGKKPTQLSFYTADTKGKFIITLEGITRDGILCRKTAHLKIKD